MGENSPGPLWSALRGCRALGFKTADELAMKLGINRNSPYRARAAVQYTLQEMAGEGHCGYPEPGLVEQAIGQ